MNDLDHFSCVALHILLEIFFFFWSYCVACGILGPQPGDEPLYLAVEVRCRVLSTGLTGNSRGLFF